LMKSLANLTSTLGTSNPLPPPPLPFAAAMAPPARADAGSPERRCAVRARVDDARDSQRTEG
jgi:hypothetical protein